VNYGRVARGEGEKGKLETRKRKREIGKGQRGSSRPQADAFVPQNRPRRERRAGAMREEKRRPASFGPAKPSGTQNARMTGWGRGWEHSGNMNWPGDWPMGQRWEGNRGDKWVGTPANGFVRLIAGKGYPQLRGGFVGLNQGRGSNQPPHPTHPKGTPLEV
jgi:hypothetical protein